MKIDEIYIASDHAGFDAKEKVKGCLCQMGFKVIDLGCKSAEISVDYPDFAHKLSNHIKDDKFGVLICGSGIGVSISANRHPKVRCALCHDTYSAKLSRLHNDANVLAFGARILGFGEIEEIVKTFFSTEFEGGRHARRVGKIEL